MGMLEMVMPKMGESVMEGTIIRWLKKEGETIRQDESVLEVATDKVDTEVPAPFAGVLKQILARENEVVPVGKPIALIETQVAESTATATHRPPTPAQKTSSLSTEKSSASNVATDGSRPFYSPLVMNIARQENISLAELETIVGTGNNGRVTKEDILAYVAQRHQKKNVAAATATAEVTHTPSPQHTVFVSEEKVESPATSLSGADEIIE
ncbi:MAG: E3 binding domain-containing protein, partial [Flammeovirgaceae bacterium]|nr:E3 binding domain-containing protein [Flammeovirgaceae bacterium]MDW8288819.1 biotin/lipoyl-containing protein [Flammeovirgaceae bacterium]